MHEAGITLLDCDHKTPKTQNEGLPYVGIPQLKDGRVTLAGARLISNDDFVHWRRKAKPSPHDVVLSRRCNPGETAYVPAGLEVALGQNLVLLRSDGARVFPKFLRWVVKTPNWWYQVGKYINVGAVFDSLRCADIPKFEITLPPIEAQIRIDEILSSIDSRIELNQEINRNLEQIAQAIFKSWFVDFEPVNAKQHIRAIGGNDEQTERAAQAVIAGAVNLDVITGATELSALDQQLVEALSEKLAYQTDEQREQLVGTSRHFPDRLVESELGLIPQGWAASTIDNECDLIIDHRGKTPKKLGGEWSAHGYPAISAKNIKNGRLLNLESIRYVKKSLYRKWMSDELAFGDVILTSEAPLGEVYYLASKDRYVLSQRLYGLRARAESISGSFLYYWLRSSAGRADLESRGTGTTVIGIRQSELRKIAILRPSRGLVKEYTAVANRIHEEINCLHTESGCLTKTSDALLPKLLSGELSVDKVA